MHVKHLLFVLYSLMSNNNKHCYTKKTLHSYQVICAAACSTYQNVFSTSLSLRA